jgi:hypothetical protein
MVMFKARFKAAAGDEKPTPANERKQDRRPTAPPVGDPQGSPKAPVKLPGEAKLPERAG